MNNVDILVGKRVRHARWLLGVTQEELAEILCVNVAYLQDQERGKLGIKASQLFTLCELFDLPIRFFFSTLEEGVANDFAGWQTSKIQGSKKVRLPEDRIGLPGHLRRKQQNDVVAIFRTKIDMCCARAVRGSHKSE